jgi:hypothetical protein
MSPPDKGRPPVDLARLLAADLTAEAAEKLLSASDCSLQRHPGARCVRVHGMDRRMCLNGAVHKANFRPSLTARAIEMIDSVLSR